MEELARVAGAEAAGAASSSPTSAPGRAWRRPIASLNILLASHVWRQDHNGFTHQDPGFIDHVVNKKAEIIRVYLPPETNTLLSVATTACGAGTTSTSSWPASTRRRSGSTWTPRSSIARPGSHLGLGQQRQGSEARVVMACAGDVPTLETLAAVQLLREHIPR